MPTFTDLTRLAKGLYPHSLNPSSVSPIIGLDYKRNPARGLLQPRYLRLFLSSSICPVRRCGPNHSISFLTTLRLFRVTRFAPLSPLLPHTCGSLRQAMRLFVSAIIEGLEYLRNFPVLYCRRALITSSHLDPVMPPGPD